MDDLFELVVVSMIGGMIGFFCGFIPSKAAMARNQTGFATMSLVICVLVGMLGGCVLALPTAWILKLIVVAMGEKQFAMHESGVSMEDYHATRQAVGRKKFVADPLISRAPYTEVGPVVVCNECRKACSKVNGSPPPSCPNCDEPFDDIPVARKVKKKAKAAARQDEGEDLVDLKRV